MSNTETALPKTKEEFTQFVAAIQADDGYMPPAAFGLGYVLSRKTPDGKWVEVDVHFMAVSCGNNAGTAALLSSALGINTSSLDNYTSVLSREQVRWMLDVFAPFGREPGHANIDALVRLYEYDGPHLADLHRISPVAVWLPSLDAPPQDMVDAYFRLNLLSHCLVQPHGVNVDGVFGKLPNVLWTSTGAIPEDSLEQMRWEANMRGEQLVVHSKDKFPKLLDHVSPPGVRIVNTQSVRLGAHLAPGTVVMPAGFVNFNAGTLGEAMVEGRISAGVTVGARSDIGGGASTQGTLSGGNDVIVSIGEDCLLEAECGLGIPVGDRVRIEAGFYLKSTTPVYVLNYSTWTDQPAAMYKGRTVRADDLCGISDAIFRRNAGNGQVEVLPRGDSIWGKLNPDLHNN